MGELEVDFKFHNVGQGLFYTGRLKYGRASFNFVYDCGAWEWGKDDYYTNLVKNAIKGEFSRHDKIDLLIISHLHADHTNGLSHLLRRVKEVDTVILPYLSPLERLVVALETPAASGEFYDFLADPVMFLLDRGVNRVILVGIGEPGREEDWWHVGSFSDDYNEERASFDIQIDMPDIDINRVPEDLKNEYGEETLKGLIKDGKLFVKEHRGRIFALLNQRPIWIFRLFNYNITPKELFNFKNCVQQKLGNKAIKDAIKSRYIRSKLKECYERHINKDLNETSLVVLHFPAFNLNPAGILLVSSNDVSSWFRVKGKFFMESQPWKVHIPFKVLQIKDGMSFSQLLTGDINLNHKFNEISQHFGLGTVVTNTMVTLVPHHGSHNNWNNALCNTITCKFWVVSAGIHNEHGHPSPLVLLDICLRSAYHRVMWVNEATYFRLMGVLEF